MKESGINYFFSQLGLDTGSFGVFYTFEEGIGTKINSVSGGQSQYSGILSNATNFWVKDGSGFFSGNTIDVANSSGLYSDSWTKVFVYEKVNTDELVLFNSLNGLTGCKIGITPTNKPYFETFNIEPILATSSNNLSSKNVISFSYMTNYLNIGYYNFNSKELEYESFNYPFQLNQSDIWKIGGGTGYIDYFIYFNQYYGPDVLSQLFSGFFARPTGIGYETETVYVTGLSGYQDVFVGETGITGYIITPNGDEGRDFYTGAFPTSYSQIALTGYLSSGLYSSGVFNITTATITGESFGLLEILTGYVSSFGMEKLQIFPTIDGGDVVKLSVDRSLFNNIYNKNGLRSFSAYQLQRFYESGELNLFYNGLAQWRTGWSTSGDYLYINGSEASDLAHFDVKSGDFRLFDVTGSLTTFNLTYSGQQIYLNGLNLISGYDFTVSGSFSLLNRNTGFNGYLFEYPIVLPSETGNFNLKITTPFSRNTSNLYINGLRQKNKNDYLEGAFVDLLSGNFYNYSGIENIYDNNDNYWEF